MPLKRRVNCYFCKHEVEIESTVNIFFCEECNGQNEIIEADLTVPVSDVKDSEATDRRIMEIITHHISGSWSVSG